MLQSNWIVPKVLVVLLTAVSLGFAAVEVAVASPAIACPYDGQTHLGECIAGDGECANACRIANGPEATGSCGPAPGGDNCCVCIY